MTTLSSPFERLKLGSPSLSRLLEHAERAAVSSAPVLVLGEAGSGRTALARTLHAASERRHGPLVELDPSTLPAGLFESELFGHRPGAFTGASEAMAGRVARARGGSLLLDHVEETPLPAQAKLLRLLAENRFAPLGGSEVEADVRFLAVGVADLPHRVETGLFRADLYFRLEVVTLRLAPLRERMDDLRPLIDHFLSDLGTRLGGAPPRLSDRALRWMEAYDWPGNLRELRNTLEREAVLQRGAVLDPPPPGRSIGPPRSLAEVEREQISRALEYTRGHQGRAAELLGISRKALWQKRRRHGLP